MGCGEVSLGHNAYPTSNFKPKGLDLFAVEIIIKLADIYVKYLMLTFFPQTQNVSTASKPQRGLYLSKEGNLGQVGSESRAERE